MPDILTQLADPHVLALQVRAEQWPRSFFSATLIPDAWMSLLESPEGWRKFIPAGEDPRPDSAARLTLVRNRPIVLPLAAQNLFAASGEDISIDAELLLRWPARDDDLAALAHQLSSAGQRLTQDDLTRRFAPAMQETLRSFVRTHSAAELLEHDQRDNLSQFLRQQLHGVALEWGLSLERINRLHCSSRAVTERTARDQDAARRIEAIQSRQMVEQAALAATQQRIAGLRTAFEKLQEDAPVEGGWRELLPMLDPTERSRLLTNLWRLMPSARRTSAIAAISAKRCLLLDVQDPERVLRTIEVPADLGALRSVVTPDQSCDDQSRDREGANAPHDQAPLPFSLLIGATTGVWRVSLQSDAAPIAYAVPNVAAPTHRFNSVLCVSGWILATNTQLGCCGWPASDPASFCRVFEPPPSTRSVRALCRGGNRQYFACDDQLFRLVLDPARSLIQCAIFGPAAGSTIHALAADDSATYASCGDGTIRALRNGASTWEIMERLSAPAATLTVRNWSGVTELIVPDQRRGVIAIYPDERVTAPMLQAPTAFAGQPTPLQKAWATDSAVTALNQDLGRLYVRTLEMADEVQREVLLSRLLGGLVEDVALL